MASKRKLKRVPHALHSELSEYASLLRALDTNDTLDVARQITSAPPPKKRRKLEKKPPPLDEDLEGLGEGSSQLGAPSIDPEPEGEEPPKRKHSRKRDTWTRWPLLLHDVHVPAWGLDDEIAALARLCLHNSNKKPPKASQDADLEDDSPSYLPHVAHSASAFLSSVLALLAHHTPARPQSMQDRLNPLNWQTVLEVVAACGDVDVTMISNVKSRMEAIYGPYESSSAVERVQTRAAGKSRIASALDDADDALLSLVRPRAGDADADADGPKPLVEFDLEEEDEDEDEEKEPDDLND